MALPPISLPATQPWQDWESFHCMGKTSLPNCAGGAKRPLCPSPKCPWAALCLLGPPWCLLPLTAVLPPPPGASTLAPTPSKQLPVGLRDGMAGTKQWSRSWGWLLAPLPRVPMPAGNGQLAGPCACRGVALACFSSPGPQAMWAPPWPVPSTLGQWLCPLGRVT